MKDILLQLPELKQQGKAFVLCLVTEAHGSTPRKEGARMLVFDDGSIMGTIGGGSIELQAIADARDVLASGKPAKKKYKLEDDLQMHCGGSMEVYFEPFAEDLKLYIFGAGHVGREVGRYAAELGFRVVFIDHRPEIFKEFESQYAHCIASDYIQALDQLKFTPRDFVVITTPKHEYDENLLEHLAKKHLAYLGMIGSKRKVAEARKRLLSEKALTEAQLDFVDMPIGIPFNAETPREIAISIVAKLIDVKNNCNL
ncbi:MAG: XdhC family protein [Bacteroidales bacterium]|nr:XdhC family protein [Bacteroidales bacterium]